MSIEIERKFLTKNEDWRQQVTGSVVIVQGYLSRGAVTVRVRLSGQQAWLTVKGPAHGISRAEFEYPVPLEDGQQLLALCDGHVVKKIRHQIPAGLLLWEIDEFAEQHSGLVIAEIELPSEHCSFERPSWLGQEVSEDPRYRNSSLAML
jgi:adenylate cyclase